MGSYIYFFDRHFLYWRKYCQHKLKIKNQHFGVETMTLFLWSECTNSYSYQLGSNDQVSNEMMSQILYNLLQSFNQSSEIECLWFFLNRLTTQPTKRDGIKRSKRTKVRSEKTKTLFSFIKSPLPPKVVAVIGSPTLIDPPPAKRRSPSYSQKSNSCTNFVAQFFHARRIWKVDALLWVVRRRRAATFDAERRRFATRGLLGLAESKDLILWYDATSSE